jgi:hypothetical protein
LIANDEQVKEFLRKEQERWITFYL